MTQKTAPATALPVPACHEYREASGIASCGFSIKYANQTTFKLKLEIGKVHVSVLKWLRFFEGVTGTDWNAFAFTPGVYFDKLSNHPSY